MGGGEERGMLRALGDEAGAPRGCQGSGFRGSDGDKRPVKARHREGGPGARSGRPRRPYGFRQSPPCPPPPSSAEPLAFEGGLERPSTGVACLVWRPLLCHRACLVGVVRAGPEWAR